MITNECRHAEQCRAFLDPRSGVLRLCTNHFIEHLEGRIAELEDTKALLLSRIGTLNRALDRMEEEKRA